MKTAECHQAPNAQRYQAGKRNTSEALKIAYSSKDCQRNARVTPV